MLLCPPQADCKLLKRAESYQACTHFYAARVMESVFVLSTFDVKTEWKRERECNYKCNNILNSNEKMFSIYFPSYRLCGTSPQLENMFHGKHMCAILLLLTHM